jgi:hypothetical protein
MDNTSNDSLSMSCEKVVRRYWFFQQYFYCHIGSSRISRETNVPSRYIYHSQTYIKPAAPRLLGKREACRLLQITSE